MYQNLDQKIKFFVPESKNPGDFTTVFFMIDESNNVRLQLSIYDRSSLPNLKTSETRFDAIPLDEFFSCHRNPIADREIKGVWYDKKSKTFYLFINRFFRKIQSDLVADNFKLPPNPTFESLKFNGSLYPEFEIINSRYVKTVGDTSYLATSVDFVFELSAESLADKLLPIENGSLIDRCPKQSLVVEGEVFCFGETDYYHLIDLENLRNVSKINADVGRKNKVVHRISEIFQGTNIQYEKNQRLKFIFNYQKNQVVFATATNLFLFNYEKFMISAETKRLSTKYTAQDSVEVKINCLLDPYSQPSCDHQGISTTPYRPTDLITTGTPYDLIRANLDILIISFLVLLLVLILLTFVIVRTIQSRKRPIIKYNLYVKGMDGLSRLGSSFASRIFKKKSDVSTEAIKDKAKPAVSTSPKKAKAKAKAKSMTGDSGSIISSNLTVGSRKSAKSVNYTNPQSKSLSSKRNTEMDLNKKKKSAYLN